MSSKARLIALILGILMLATACLPGDGKNTLEKPAGFWAGLWHGIVAPVSLIVQIFNKSIRVYEKNNKGFWYDLGFWLALTSGAGGGGVAAKRRRAEVRWRRVEEEGEA